MDLSELHKIARTDHVKKCIEPVALSLGWKLERVTYDAGYQDKWTAKVYLEVDPELTLQAEFCTPGNRGSDLDHNDLTNPAVVKTAFEEAVATVRKRMAGLKKRNETFVMPADSSIRYIVDIGWRVNTKISITKDKTSHTVNCSDYTTFSTEFASLDRKIKSKSTRKSDMAKTIKSHLEALHCSIKCQQDSISVSWRDCKWYFNTKNDTNLQEKIDCIKQVISLF